MTRVTFFFDASGRVARSTAGYELITIAGIAIASSELDRVRGSLPSDARKWADATRTESGALIDLALDAAVAAIVVQVRKVKEAWEEFWDKGDEHHRRLSSQQLGRIDYPAKAEPLIRYALYASTTGPLLAECLKRDEPVLVDARGRRIVELDVIPDSDVQGTLNTETFDFLFRSYPQKSELLRLLGVGLVVDSVAFKTEQEEVLLLFPDHLAGCIHADASKLVPRYMNRDEVVDLSRRVRSSAKTEVKTIDFDLRYEDLLPSWKTQGRE